MIFRRAAMLTLAWVLIGFGVNFEGDTPTQASPGEQTVSSSTSPTKLAPEFQPTDAQ
jgi:hypothetical protein